MFSVTATVCYDFRPSGFDFSNNMASYMFGEDPSTMLYPDEEILRVTSARNPICIRRGEKEIYICYQIQNGKAVISIGNQFYDSCEKAEQAFKNMMAEVSADLKEKERKIISKSEDTNQIVKEIKNWFVTAFFDMSPSFSQS